MNLGCLKQAFENHWNGSSLTQQCNWLGCPRDVHLSSILGSETQADDAHGFLCDAADQKPDLHSCIANTFPTEPLPPITLKKSTKHNWKNNEYYDTT